MDHSGPFQLICPQHQIKCCVSCHAAARLAAIGAAAVDEHNYPVPPSAIVWGYHAAMYWNLMHFWKTS